MFYKISFSSYWKYEYFTSFSASPFFCCSIFFFLKKISFSRNHYFKETFNFSFRVFHSRSAFHRQQYNEKANRGEGNTRTAECFSGRGGVEGNFLCAAPQIYSRYSDQHALNHPHPHTTFIFTPFVEQCSVADWLRLIVRESKCYKPLSQLPVIHQSVFY